MVREIVIWPDPILKEVAKPVDRVDDTIRRLLDDMAETMYAADGVGLAAPQVAESEAASSSSTPRPRQEGQKLIHLVNPEIVRTEGRDHATPRAACRSPARPRTSTAPRRSGCARSTTTASRSSSRRTGCSPSRSSTSTDHLKGTLFVDHLSSLKRELIRSG